jgi:hypothetical protein
MTHTNSSASLTAAEIIAVDYPTDGIENPGSTRASPGRPGRSGEGRRTGNYRRGEEKGGPPSEGSARLVPRTARVPGASGPTHRPFDGVTRSTPTTRVVGASWSACATSVSDRQGPLPGRPATPARAAAPLQHEADEHDDDNGDGGGRPLAPSRKRTQIRADQEPQRAHCPSKPMHDELSPAAGTRERGHPGLGNRRRNSPQVTCRTPRR